MIDSETYTTGQVARFAGVTPNTIAQWDVEGLVGPSKQSLKYHPRKYTFHDAVAVSLASSLLKINLSRDDVRRIVGVVQRGDEKELECGVIVAIADPVTRLPKVVFFSNIADDAQWDEIQIAKDENRFTEIQTIKEIVDGVLKITQEMIDVGGLAQNPAES